MRIFILIFCGVSGMTTSENDGWVWKDDTERTGRLDDLRYQIHERPEETADFERPIGFEPSNVRPPIGSKPQYSGPLVGYRPTNSGAYGLGNRPIVPAYESNTGVLVGPGGPTGIYNRPHQSDIKNSDDDFVSSDAIPLWVRNDPRYREYDMCTCRYSFNCPSTGLKFGSCSNDKKYCCFNSRRYPGLQISEQFGGGYNPSYSGPLYNPRPVGIGSSPNHYGNHGPYGNYYGNRYPHDGYHLHHEDRNDYKSPSNRPTLEIYARSTSKNKTAEN